MTEQEAVKKLQDLAKQIGQLKPLTNEEIEQIRETTKQTPEIMELKKQIGELKAIDEALTRRRR